MESPTVRLVGDRFGVAHSPPATTRSTRFRKQLPIMKKALFSASVRLAGFSALFGAFATAITTRNARW